MSEQEQLVNRQAQILRDRIAAANETGQRSFVVDFRVLRDTCQLEDLRFLACMRLSADSESTRVFMIDQNDPDDIRMLGKCALPYTPEQRQRFKYSDQMFVCCDEQLLLAPGCFAVEKKGSIGSFCAVM